jgi:hypothetical protein
MTSSWIEKVRAESKSQIPPEKRVRIGSLRTLAGLRREQMRLYKAARRAAGPDPTPEQVAKLTYALHCLYRSVEYETLQSALERIERRLTPLEQCLYGR